jgi:hypothetical protein
MRLLQLLLEQQRAGFPDLGGAHAAVTVPVSEQLVTRMIREWLPPSAPVRDVDLRARAGNTVTVGFRAARPAFLPRFTVPLAIEQQPDLPSTPVIVLRLLRSGGLMSFAAPLLRYFKVLPPGVSVEGDLIRVHLQELLEQHGQAEALQYVKELRVETDDGRLILSVQVRIEK